MFAVQRTGETDCQRLPMTTFYIPLRLILGSLQSGSHTTHFSLIDRVLIEFLGDFVRGFGFGDTVRPGQALARDALRVAHLRAICLKLRHGRDIGKFP